jgi:hypothetical protein
VSIGGSGAARSSKAGPTASICSTSGDSSTGLSRGWPTFDGCAPLKPWPGRSASSTSTLERQQGEKAFLGRQKGGFYASETQFHCVSLRCPCRTRAGGRERRFAATPDQPATLEEASDQIGKLFAQRAMPDDIAEAIRRAYAKLGAYAGLGEGDAPVAVRSSATAEDLPGASFAGQQETYLNIRGAQAVLAAVRKCWASLWTGRAIAYRLRQGIPPESVALAVVVQLLVPAEVAGILFTANPLNGRRGEIVTNAVWGLGEAIVEGGSRPIRSSPTRPWGRSRRYGWPTRRC